MDPIAVGAPGPFGAPQRAAVALRRDARVISNGAYTVLLYGDGTGRSWAGDLSLTAPPLDPRLDASGVRVYLRDLATGRFALLGCDGATTQLAPWTPGVASLATRRCLDLDCTLEVAVSPHSPREVRRLTLHDRSGRARRIEITTFVELALTTSPAHAAHPAFSKLFVQTAFEDGAAAGVLLARRRPRAAGEETPWAYHAIVGRGASEFETDRARFIGRGRDVMRPEALRGRQPLSGTAGNVLDPAFCLRRVVEIDPVSSARLGFVWGVATDRDSAIADARALDGAADLEATFAAPGGPVVQGIDPRAAAAAETLAGALLESEPALCEPVAESWGGDARLPEAPSTSIARGRRIVAVHAGADWPVIRTATRWWRALSLPIDVFAVRPGDAPVPGTDDGLLGLGSDCEHAGSLAIFNATAQLVVREGGWPELQAGLPVAASAGHASSRPAPSHGDAAIGDGSDPDPAAALEFANGTGGFTDDGRAYALRVRADVGGDLHGLPPQPWTNVLANPHFGCIVSETGAGTVWSRNSREHRLTAWSNDAVIDPHGDALYLRDEDDGSFWSPLPGPAPAGGTSFDVQHGFGWTRFRSTSCGIAAEVEFLVPRQDPLRIVRVRLVNRGQRPRRLSLFGYVHWVLGTTPESSTAVVTAITADGRTVTARNPCGGAFAEDLAFATAIAPPECVVRASADRTAFLGRPASMRMPRAVAEGAALGPGLGHGLDACAAHQVECALAPGGSIEVAFLLGSVTEDLDAVLDRYATLTAIEVECAATVAEWEQLAGGIRIETPSRALDILFNGWLPYQTLACRLWGRSAFYQSGGAFGFRDQLQDAASLVALRPDLLREQILRHAAHQFPEGDVLHWWHEPGARGIRSRFADDLLWLPYLTAHYVQVTGDTAILDVKVPFVEARLLEDGEDEAFLTAHETAEQATLYDHCCRALDRSLTRGEHGLPLFGTGDWNDGMNRVGREGRGESVWMGFFLERVLADFTPHCERRHDLARVHAFAAYRASLRDALATAGWDGEWYRRAYDDDGVPLGSRENQECRIDALVQAWAVLSEHADPERARAALGAVERELIRIEEGLIRLLWPPFVETAQDPGYIKGYVAGVRENGGQYTHAALWVVRAFAEMGRNDRVASLLEMLSPVSHTATPAAVARYRVEPYVVAADVYAVPPHVGRGGWTWYTGSSGWMYRVILESLLGMRIVNGDRFRFTPCVPDDWSGFRIEYTVPGSGARYEIVAHNPHRDGRGVASATHDGARVECAGGTAEIVFAAAGGLHRIELVLGGRP